MSLKEDTAAAMAAQQADPKTAQVRAQTSSAQGSAQSSVASAHESETLLPSKARKGAAEADIAEGKAQQAKDAAARAETNRRLAGLRGQEDTLNILTNIQQARDNIGPTSMGIPGQIMQHIWNTKSSDLHSSLESIMGPGVIDKLGELKSQSASGASGFGALSQKELDLIKASIGEIKQSQSPAQLMNNLNRLEEHYRRFQAYNAGVDPNTPEGAHAAGLIGASPEEGGAKITNEGTWKENPKRTGMNSTIKAMVEAGRSADDIRAWADSVEPGLGAKLRGVDEVVIDHKSTKRPPDINVEHEFVPATEGASKDMGAMLNSAPGAFAAGSTDAISSGFADEAAAAGGTGTRAGNEAVYRGLQEEHPLPYLAGQAAGSLAQYAMLGPLVGKYLGPMGTEAIQNTTYGMGSAQPGDRMASGVTSGVTGFLGDRFLKSAVRVPSRMIGGVDNPAAQQLVKEGVPVTAGQLLGGGAKELEDKATSWPFIGPPITKRRQDAYRGFNRAAFNKAMSFIGGKVDNVGEAGVAEAQQQVSAAYDRALHGTTLVTDPAFDAARTNALASFAGIHNIGPELESAARKIFDGAIDPATGVISGERYQVMMQQLRDLRTSYKGERQFSLDIKPVLDDIDDEAEGLFTRQAPDRAEIFKAANTANRHVSIIGEAVNNAPANADGVFTPAQLRAKSRQNTAVYASKRASARGDRPFYDLDRAGRTTLPSNYPDSGTAGRLLLPLAAGAIAGGGTIGMEATDGESGIDIGTPLINTALGSLVGAMPYSRLAQAGVRRALSGPRSPMAQAVGDLGSKYLAPGVATAFRPQSAGFLADRTPNPDTPYKPMPVPAGAAPEPEPEAKGPVIPPGAIVDTNTNEIVMPDGKRIPLGEEAVGMAYGGAVRRLSQRYNCGGRVVRR